MYKYINTYKAKAVLCFCLILIASSVIAQNTSHYKYVIAPMDTCRTANSDILEVNNHYYLLSRPNTDADHGVPIIAVYNEDLNQIEQILLYDIDSAFFPHRFFYKDNYFYVLGCVYDSTNISLDRFCYAKYDTNFRLAQPVISYTLQDTIFRLIDTVVRNNDTIIYDYIVGGAGYGLSDIFMTQSDEFIIHFNLEGKQGNGSKGRLFHFDTTGRVLHDMFVPPLFIFGTMVETDIHYIMNYFYARTYIRLYPKDSFENYQEVELEENYSDDYFGTAITVGNQLIRDYEQWYGVPECINDITTLRSIAFFDENLLLKKRLDIVGDRCAQNLYGGRNMHYLNPDSIYYVYRVLRYPSSVNYGLGESTLAIACFSSEGELHFNHVLDLPKGIVYNNYLYCKALTNGGVLIAGELRIKDIDIYPYNYRGYMLLYHPTKGFSSIEEYTEGEDIQVYPNPAQSQFTVTNTENANLTLYNVLGQQVKQVAGTGENTLIHTEGLPQGIYILKVEKEGAVLTKKIQISN